MANIKQDELWVDLLFDGTTSFYLALAESKRFRLGHIRNGKISYQLYPKRKDFVSLNVAIKNLAALQCFYDAERQNVCWTEIELENNKELWINDGDTQRDRASQSSFCPSFQPPTTLRNPLYLQNFLCFLVDVFYCKRENKNTGRRALTFTVLCLFHLYRPEMGSNQ